MRGTSRVLLALHATRLVARDHDQGFLCTVLGGCASITALCHTLNQCGGSHRRALGDNGVSPSPLRKVVRGPALVRRSEVTQCRKWVLLNGHRIPQFFVLLKLVQRPRWGNVKSIAEVGSRPEHHSHLDRGSRTNAHSLKYPRLFLSRPTGRQGCAQLPGGTRLRKRNGWHARRASESSDAKWMQVNFLLKFLQQR